MNTPALIGAIVVLVIVLWFLNKQSKKPRQNVHGPSNDMTIYGSMGCPYTVKQVEKYPDAEFVDCASGKCPEWVKGFPTTKMPDGSTVVGFSD
jgi:hypothetical protein